MTSPYHGSFFDVRHVVRLGAFLVLLLLTLSAYAMREFSLGNDPVQDGNSPAGTADLANLPSRVAVESGPLDGETEFLYQGDVTELQEALDKFAQIRAPERRLVIHEGPHESFILKDDRKPNADTSVDWTLTVWDPASWHKLYNDPLSFFLADLQGDRFRQPVAPPTLDVYVAGAAGQGLDWKKIKVPAGLTIIDARASSAGYKPEDGSVIRGEVYNLLTSKPIAAARVSVTMTKVAGNVQGQVITAQADAQGRFELKNIPSTACELQVAADGYVARNLGFLDLGLHGFKTYTVQLAAPATMKGTVRDTGGKPLAGVTVRPMSILALDGRGYSLATPVEATTDAQGAFELSGVPPGYLQLDCSLKSHHPLDVFHIHKAPASDLVLQMTATGTVKGKVLQTEGTAVTEANVSINPPGALADRVGTWGGSMKVHPDGTFQFDNVPPGVYVISPDFNPIADHEDPLAKTITVKADETTEVQLTAAARK